MVGDNLTLTSISQIYSARLLPCFNNVLFHTYRVNDRLAFDKHADESILKAPNPYVGKQGRLKNPNNFLEPIWQIGLVHLRAFVENADSVEQKRNQQVFIELDVCIEVKEDADFSSDWWSSYLPLQ